MSLTYLGFDYGEQRIGVALAHSLTGQAKPLTTVANQWPLIEALLREWQPDICIVGLPLAMDGSDQPISLAARKFARRLQAEGPKQVYLCDERMSSIAAQDMLRAQRASGQRKRRLRKGDIDSQSACVILQQWLDGEERDDEGSFDQQR